MIFHGYSKGHKSMYFSACLDMYDLEFVAYGPTFEACKGNVLEQLEDHLKEVQKTIELVKNSAHEASTQG